MPSGMRGPDTAVTNYITLKVSKTEILAPPCRTGHPFALVTASSSESAVITE